MSSLQNGRQSSCPAGLAYITIISGPMSKPGLIPLFEEASMRGAPMLKIVLTMVADPGH